jgi:hypothetical protein
MKNIIITLILFQIALLGQTSWTPQSTVPNYTINSLDKIESYTNSDGNHLVINNSGTVKYILLNTSGGIIRQRTLDSGCEYSNYTIAITGYQNELYVVYQKGVKIKIAKSTNAGDTWNYSNEQLIMDNSNCNGIDAVYDSRGLHLVWAVQFGNYYETYYERYRRIAPDWEGYKQVTDYDQYTVGGRPSVVTTPNKIHVAYNHASQPQIGHASSSYTRSVSENIVFSNSQ